MRTDVKTFDLDQIHGANTSKDRLLSPYRILCDGAQTLRNLYASMRNHGAHAQRTLQSIRSTDLSSLVLIYAIILHDFAHLSIQ